MAAISLKLEAKEAMKDLDGIQKKQIPFVMAKTLTQTAKGAAEAVRMRTRRAFRLHSEFIPKGVRFKPARKNRNINLINSVVYTAPRISGFMPDHERGKTRRPFASGGSDRGRAIALPGKGLLERSFKTRTGKVRARWTPKRMLQWFNDENNRANVRKGRGGRRKAFLNYSKRSGTLLVLRRVSRRRYPLEVLYYFDKEVGIKRSWKFESTARKYAQFAFGKKFARNMADAIKS